MRKGFYWAAAVLLASSSLVKAQQEPVAAVMLPTLPDTTTVPAKAITDPAKAPDLSKPGLGAPDVSGCFNNCCDTPLRVWVNAEYLLWWVKGGPVNSPVVTSSTSLTDRPPGGVGQPGTHVLFGDQNMGYGTASGVRFGLGVELASGLALEGNYFVLENRSFHFSAASNGAGSPLIGRSFFNTQGGFEDALLDSDFDPRLPLVGGASAISHSRLQGWELNLAGNGGIFSGWKITALGGFRAVILDEDLNISDTVQPLANGLLTFLGPTGPPVAANNIITDYDNFHTSNNFYGGQIGGRAEKQFGNLSVGLVGKIAFGVNQQSVTIDGASSLLSPTAPTITVPGGVLAQTSNIGHYSRNVFSVVPEGGLNLGWDITPRITANVGYTFMYMSNVVRPGDQIDHSVNPALIPTHQLFGNGLGGSQPGFSFQNSSYWAQGLNFGLEFKF